MKKKVSFRGTLVASLLALSLITLFAIIVPTSAQAFTTVFFDDFTATDGTSLITHNSVYSYNPGDAIIENNTLTNTVEDTGISLPSYVLGDQCISLDALFPLVNAVTLDALQGFDSSNNQYHYFMDVFMNGTIRLKATVHGGDIQYAETSVSLSQGWHNLKLCSIGSTLTGYVDNGIISSVTATDLQDQGFTTGYPSFLLHVGEHIDNLRLESNIPTTPTPTDPVSKEECKKYGWQNFLSSLFKNQGACVSYFETVKE